MNRKTKQLIAMTRIAFAAWRGDDEDGVSVETGTANILRLEQLAIDVTEEYDPDINQFRWLGFQSACHHLRNVYRVHGGDPNGEVTHDLNVAYDRLEIDDLDLAW